MPESKLLEALNAFTKKVTIWMAALTLVLALVGVAVLIGFIKYENLASQNCENIRGLADINRTFITSQQQQTTNLLKGGFTFGLPKDKLDQAIAASEKTQAAYLNSFDALALNNC